MKQFQYVITDPLGIRARPAGMLAKIDDFPIHQGRLRVTRLYAGDRVGRFL